MNLTVQWMTMAAMLLSGLGMGVVFDGYRVLSDELRISRWWIPVFDLLYWIAATIAVFHVLSANNEGEVRAYVFIGLLIGIGLYYWLFSKVVVRLTQIVIHAVRAIIRFSVRAFVLLVVRPVQLLFRLAKILIAFLLALSMFLLKIVVQLVRPLWLLLRFALKPLVSPIGKRISGWAAPLLAKSGIKEKSRAAIDSAVRLWRRLTGKKSG